MRVPISNTHIRCRMRQYFKSFVLLYVRPYFKYRQRLRIQLKLQVEIRFYIFVQMLCCAHDSIHYPIFPHSHYQITAWVLDLSSNTAHSCCVSQILLYNAPNTILPLWSSKGIPHSRYSMLYAHVV